MGKYKPPMIRDRPDPTGQALQRAEELQKQAERKRGSDALPALQQAAVAYKEALRLHSEHALPEDRLADCHFGLGDCLQQLGDSIIESCAGLPNAELTAEVEVDARKNAGAVFKQAVQAYRKVKVSPEDGRVRVDACVNSANTLSSWAAMETAQGEAGKASQLLVAAVEGCRRALEQEEDAATWSNLADMLVARAELLDEAAESEASVAAVYGEAMAAYSKACMLSSSEEGDDLPGLLNNWGVGLHSLGTHAKNQHLALTSLEEAAHRLREAISFSRGDPQPHNALGDTLMARADLAGDSSEALGCLNMALQEGYAAALRLLSTDADALIGKAEVHTALGKLALSADNRDVAGSHFREALQSYVAALRTPEALGALRDRSDTRYNYACVCAHALTCGALTGSDVAAAQQECVTILAQLASIGMTTSDQIVTDPDFSRVRQEAWFLPLLQSGSTQQVPTQSAMS